MSWLSHKLSKMKAGIIEHLIEERFNYLVTIVLALIAQLVVYIVFAQLFESQSGFIESITTQTTKLLLLLLS